MTLHPDIGWPFGDWCLDCDDCGNHVHIGREDSKLSDPRMSSRANEWTLDVYGKDYCPDCDVPA